MNEWLFRQLQVMVTCYGCGQDGASKKCGQCNVAVYCSKACQTTHWVDNHKRLCRIIGNCRITGKEIRQQYAFLLSTMSQPDYDHVQANIERCIAICEELGETDPLMVAKIVRRETLVYLSPVQVCFEIESTTTDRKEINRAITRLPLHLQCLAREIVESRSPGQELWKVNDAVLPLVIEDWSCVDHWDITKLQATLSVRSCTGVAVVMCGVFTKLGIDHAIVVGDRSAPKYSPMLTWRVELDPSHSPLKQLGEHFLNDFDTGHTAVLVPGVGIVDASDAQWKPDVDVGVYASAEGIFDDGKMEIHGDDLSVVTNLLNTQLRTQLIREVGNATVFRRRIAQAKMSSRR